MVKAPRRRATRKTAAPGIVAAPVETAATSTAPAGDAAASADADADAPTRAPRKAAAKRAPAKRASTRVTKKAAAPVHVDVDVVEPASAEIAPEPTAVAAAPVELLAEAPSEPAEPTTRGRGPRRATRASRSTLDVFAELAPVAASRAAAETADEPVEPADEPELATPGAMTALLFQSADATTRPRRRRAQSPAGPPRAAEEAPIEPTRTPFDTSRTPFDSGRAPSTSPAPRTDTRPEVEVEPESDAAPAKRTSRRRGSSRANAAVEELLATATPDEAPEGEVVARRDDRGDRGPRGGRGRGGRGRGARDVEEQVAPDLALDEDETAEDLAADDLTTEDVSAEDQSAEDQSAEDSTDEVDEDEESGDGGPRRRRRRGGRGRRGRSGTDDADTDSNDRNNADRNATDRPGADRGAAATDDTTPTDEDHQGADESEDDDQGGEGGGSSRRRRRRRRSGRGGEGVDSEPVSQPTRSRGGRSSAQTSPPAADEVTALRGSTRLEAKRQRRREGRDAGRRRTIVTESEFLARRESVDRSMVVREIDGATQIAVMEDGVLVEHYVSRQAQASMAGNVYLGRVQNVLPSMEAAFVDVGKGRNAVLYAGEVNWDAAGLEGQPRRIEQALKSGDSVLVQVTKDPIGQKGARLTSQVTLAGRYLVYVPGGGMTGISRKLPDNERARLKKLLREIVPDTAGVIVRTAAEGASEDELRADITRLQEQWTAIEKKAKTASSPALLQGEPDLAIRVVRDIFNGDFGSLVVEGDEAWDTISGYIGALAPDLAQKVTRWTGTGDVFAAYRVDEQLAKGMDRKVWLPSGGSLVIDRTEAMTVVDVNTGKFTGAGGTLEETVTRNNLEAAEEIVRQLRLRDIGGIIVIDFIDMVLESNRDLVLRRLVECLGRDRTKHQVAEVTSLGLVQMTRKRVGQGLVEAFSETCEHCNGRGFIVHTEPNDRAGHAGDGAQGGHSHGSASSGSTDGDSDSKGSRRKRGAAKDISALAGAAPLPAVPVLPEVRAAVKATLATIAAAAAHAHEHGHELGGRTGQPGQTGPADLPLGFDADETLELFPVAPEVFDLGEAETDTVPQQ
ncbi:Rne/Rng family ribonuclease [Pengzhenrongella frigida]|uniref:Ribonuclease E n=1 Tax=Pengzhenrongella frigida TaxID=1259133 RepID=A0A4Q5MXC6_9MICO|nr:Rne/Rng family ribonuclease [Cellulomonas sp. HLT2-17]